MLKKFNFTQKISFLSAILFTILLICVIYITSLKQEKLALYVAADASKATAEHVINALNTFMVTGSTEQIDIFINKEKMIDGVKEIRVMRGENVRKDFGDGERDNKPKDQLDKEVLQNGKSLDSLFTENGSRYYRIVLPFIASEDLRGTNCMECHMVNEGDVLGAVSITTSFDEIDKVIVENNTTLGGITATFIIVAITILMLYILFFIISPIKNASKQLKEIAEGSGDLTHRLPESGSRDEIGELTANFNKFISQIHSIVEDIIALSTTVLQHSGDLKVNSESMKNSVAEQSQNSITIASAMDEISHTVTEVAKNTEDTAISASEAETATEEGGEIIKETIVEMSKIAESVSKSAVTITELGEASKTIGDIIQSINDIAEQTNLLALNAAIEAARAGEQGRGFAVVADEVRKLAERTTKATQEITTTITRLQKDTTEVVEAMDQVKGEVDNGVDLARETETHLKTITDKIQHSSNNAALISNASNEQKTAVREIAEGVENIAETSKSINSSAESSFDLATQLEQLAVKLNNTVNKFKI